MAAQWGWSSSPKTDEWFINALESSIANLVRVAGAEGLNNTLPRYINYSITDTPVTDIWGKDNIVRLQKIKAVYDPEDVMGLAGGFKIPTLSN